MEGNTFKIKILKEKEVKITKEHECWKCRKIKEKGSKMIFNTIIDVDKRICDTYQCLKCA